MSNSGNKTQNPFGDAGQIPVPPPEFIRQIAQKIHLVFISDTEPEGNVCLADSREVRPEYRQSFALADLRNYLYAILYSPVCEQIRRTGSTFDFSSVPHPENADTFWRLAALGAELRQIHRLENRQAPEPLLARYPEGGNLVVSKLQYENGRIYINDYQYFATVPPTVWAFYAGGNPVLQNWFRERMGQVLHDEDILFCQKLAAALVETAQVMREVEKIVVV